MPREACWLGRGPACLDLEGRGTGGGQASLNLGHKVALQANYWELLRSSLTSCARAQMFPPCPARYCSMPSPAPSSAISSFHLAPSWWGIQHVRDTEANSLFLPQDENPGG